MQVEARDAAKRRRSSRRHDGENNPVPTCVARNRLDCRAEAAPIPFGLPAPSSLLRIVCLRGTRVPVLTTWRNRCRRRTARFTLRLAADPMRDSEARVANRRGGILETRPRLLQTDGIRFHACSRLHDCALEGLEREATRAQAQLLCPSDERPGEGDKQECERSPVELFAINRRTAGDTQYSAHDGERGDDTEGYIDPPRYRYQGIVP